MLLFGFPQIKAVLMRAFERRRYGGGEAVAEQYTDQLNILMRSYKEVPLYWFIALFLASFMIIIIILANSLLYIPIWTYILALVTGAVVVIVCSSSHFLSFWKLTSQPLGWLYAMSNFQLVSFPFLRALFY